MNCQNFQQIVCDLANAAEADEVARGGALAHTKDCEQCAARFADELALTTGLRALAIRSRTAEAPAHVEATLLAAFHQHTQTVARSQPLIHLPATVRLQLHRPVVLASWAVAASAAAVVLFLLFAAVSLSWQEPSPLQSQQATGAQTALPKEMTLVPEERPSSMGASAADSEQDSARRFTIGHTLGQTSDSAVRHPVTRTNQSRAARASDSADAGGAEITTEFFPLRYGEELSSMESGRVVRVEMPRSALTSLGLPINVERAGGRVRADVLLGEDGLARAIRFVH